MPTPAILLFIKAPHPGAAKTRLTPFLTPDAAASVAACLARDAVGFAAMCLPPGGRLVIAFAPDDAWPELAETVGVQSLLALPQRGVDLGERMANAVSDATSLHDLGPLVLLGADCAFMPSEAIRTAFERLGDQGPEAMDVVLGPAEDGGYYLLGLRSDHRVRPLLTGIVWSTDQVLAQTVANAKRLGLRVFDGLPRCYDIDTPEDLCRLRDDLQADPEREHIAPAIAHWLRSNPLPTLSFRVSGGAGHP
ncbi:MAG: TIGR04282 family arsenosugar biosynthesis glycosyltransferase [Armatimonadota bacterium]